MPGGRSRWRGSASTALGGPHGAINARSPPRRICHRQPGYSGPAVAKQPGPDGLIPPVGQVFGKAGLLAQGHGDSIFIERQAWMAALPQVRRQPRFACRHGLLAHLRVAPDRRRAPVRERFVMGRPIPGLVGQWRPCRAMGAACFCIPATTPAPEDEIPHRMGATGPRRRSTRPLRQPCSVAPVSRRLHGDPHLRAKAEDPQRPHLRRIHLQELDLRAGAIIPNPMEPNS